ncbi:class I SAM-dependent methyltransferase [Cryptosporangium sp. NPDC051539]|uniref:class I SAM-dependent methyltransferase n=1 Tax=Cryptosporangium sp. NPDC051539 TaxID=3363962 RepID=UPI00379773E1
MRSPDDSCDSICRVVRSTYTRHADEYVRGTSSYSSFPGLEDEVRGFLAAAPSGRVLDLGAGSGRDSRLAVEAGRRVLSCDASIGILRSRFADRAGSPVCGDALRIPFRSGSFSALIASGVLLHLPRRCCQPALEEIRRVLTPDGRAFVSMKLGRGEGWRTTPRFPHPRWFTYYQVAEFGEMCERAGLLVSATLSGDREDWFTVTLVQR